MSPVAVLSGPRFSAALSFFLYEVPKVFLLLIVIVFVMGVIRSWFSPEQTRALLSGHREGYGNVAAACLGIVTPFCSCSAVPLFLGFVSAGVPLGVTFSFLIAAPMVNEVALGLIFVLIGWKVALIYLGFGLLVAIAAGWVIGRLHLEGWLESWVRDLRVAPPAMEAERLTRRDRLQAGWVAVKEIVGKIWLWIILGIALGAGIHGYVPDDMLAGALETGRWWTVPLAVICGIPVYSNAAGIIPVIEALMEKGVSLGTALAFMMSVTALSLPEAIILRKILSMRLIAVFFSVVGGGILIVGYVFNFLLG